MSPERLMGQDCEQGDAPRGRQAGSGLGRHRQQQAPGMGMASQNTCACLGTVHMHGAEGAQVDYRGSGHRSRGNAVPRAVRQR